MLRWCVAPAACYEWRDWDGQAVVFVHATGDTHALSPEATSLLVVMRARSNETHATPAWMQFANLADGDGEALMQGLAAIGLVRYQQP